MKRLILTALLTGSVAMFAGNASAALIDVPVPSELILTDSAGNEWAWAGPCAPVSPSCGETDLSFQGPLGWSIPEVEDFAFGFDLLDFTPGGSALCASSYFSPFHSHCDGGDYSARLIYNYPTNSNLSYFEFFAIRHTAPVAVAEPGTLALVGLGLLALSLPAIRRRRSDIGLVGQS